MGKKLFLLTSLLCLVLGVSGCGYSSAVVSQTSELLAMNTYVTITVYGDNADVGCAAAAARIQELESLLSVTDTDSEIYAVNHSNGEPVTVSKDTAEVTAFALAMAAQTDGALEPTIYPVLTAWGFTTDRFRIPSPQELDELLSLVDYTRVQIANQTIAMPEGMMLDLGAVAKGYAGDEAADCLRSLGVTSAIINLGGNVQTIGCKPDGSLWRIGLQSPNADGYIGILQVANCGVVTSGGYQKYFVGEDGCTYHHLIDPATGRPAASGVVSATVVGPEGKRCDALSTALFVLGVDRAVQYWRQNPEFEMLLLTADNKIYLTAGLTEAFTLQEAYQTWPVEVIWP